jgi:hypothetical protein
MAKPYNPKKGQILKSDARGNNIDQGFIAHYAIAAADAVAAGVANVLASTVLVAAPATILPAAMAAQPPTPRVLSITGNAATVAGNVVVNGTDTNGAAITDTIASNGAATVIGAKAFATVTSIVLPVAVDPADEISVGFSDKFGIPYMLPHDTVVKILNNSVATTVAAGSSFSATVLADNFIDPAAALAAAQIDVYLLV